MTVDPTAFLRRAVELGREAVRENRGGPFGAVIVRDGVVLGEGGNLVLESKDPTAHAEIVAIRAATARTGSFSLDGATIFASSEPCPMCLSAIYWARIDAIVFGNNREDAARIGFDDSFFYDELGKPAGARAVRMRQIVLPECAALFDEWTKKPDKTPY